MDEPLNRHGRDHFLACHQDALNVEIHLLTTPLGLYAALSLFAALHPGLPAALATLYLATQAFRQPRPLWLATAAVTVGLATLATLWPTTPWGAVALLAVAWLGQEAAHHLTDEPTYQSGYQGRSGFWRQLAVHTWDLLPLVLQAAGRVELPFLRHLVARDRVVHTTLPPALLDDLRLVETWVRENLVTTEHTTHWWQDDLPQDVRAAYRRIAHHPSLHRALQEAYGPRWEVSVVEGMNEVYVTGPNPRLTSDTVFYLNHIDGPWTVFPGAAVHRCMVGVSPNRHIRTVFPLAGDGHGRVLDAGEALSFDFNRELHHIRSEPGVPPADVRINLKVHHLIHPRWAGPWGRLLARLTTAYNTRARRLFLDTLTPQGIGERLGAALVVGTTRLVDLVQRHLGWGNLLYVLALAGASIATGSLAPLVAGASFVHYLIYLATFGTSQPVAWGRFVRDAVFFKTLSMGLLATLYLKHATFDPLSLTFIVVGFGIAAMAAARLGVERTYFGVELGRIPPVHITTFPYGVIPHPMIAGAIVGLLGVHLLAPFREAWPWLVPVHVGLYLVHLVQEQTDRRRTSEAPTVAQPAGRPLAATRADEA